VLLLSSVLINVNNTVGVCVGGVFVGGMCVRVGVMCVGGGGMCGLCAV